MALSNESISDLLRRILGENCEEIIKHFENEEIDTEAFYELNKEVLIETGMNVFLFLYSIEFTEFTLVNKQSRNAMEGCNFPNFLVVVSFLNKMSPSMEICQKDMEIHGYMRKLANDI